MTRILLFSFLIPLFTTTLYGQHQWELPMEWEFAFAAEFPTGHTTFDTELQLRQGEKQRLDSMITEFYDTNFFMKDEYTFDENELLTKKRRYKRAGITGPWQDDDLFEYTNDENGNLVSYIVSDRDSNGAWSQYRKYDFERNASGNTTGLFCYLLDTEMQEWAILDRFVYLYSSDQLLLTITRESWSESEQQWSNGSQTIFDYDDEGNLISSESYNWDLSSWTLFSRDEYEYDSLQNISQVTVYLYGNLIFTEEYVYDNNYPYEDLIVHESEFTFRHKLLSETRYSPNGSIERQGTYYYSSILTDIEIPQQVDLHIFPNPADDMITFDLKNPIAASLTLWDAQGKHVDTQILQNNQLPVNQLNSGVYFYELFYDGEMYSGKFIVQ